MPASHRCSAAQSCRECWGDSHAWADAHGAPRRVHQAAAAPGMSAPRWLCRVQATGEWAPCRVLRGRRLSEHHRHRLPSIQNHGAAVWKQQGRRSQHGGRGTWNAVAEQRPPRGRDGWAAVAPRTAVPRAQVEQAEHQLAGCHQPALRPHALVTSSHRQRRLTHHRHRRRNLHHRRLRHRWVVGPDHGKRLEEEAPTGETLELQPVPYCCASRRQAGR